MTQPTDTVIRIDGVRKTYRQGTVEHEALRGVSFTVKRGEYLSIMGPSGSGKTTLMNIIGCLDTHTAGTYELDGIDVASLNDNKLADIRSRKIGFVFQTFNLLPRLTAAENVEMPLYYQGAEELREPSEVALEKVGLGQRGHHRPGQLSGGERQRVAIARALVTVPSILLADEPTGNLDTATGEEILRMFEEIHRRDGVTIVVVTHSSEVAERAERIIRVRDGLIESDGPTPRMKAGA